MNKRFRDAMLYGLIAYIIVVWVLPMIEYVVRLIWNILTLPFRLTSNRKGKELSKD